MTFTHSTLQRALILICTLFGATQAWSQVDPEWLKSWNEAQESRPDSLSPSGRIASKDEPGTPLIIRGQVLGPDASPMAGVVIHAYHRDAAGREFGTREEALTTWDLQGWVETDADGRFEFQTIRPAPDNLGREAAHIHFTLVSQDYGRQWAPKVFFADDPLVTERARRRSEAAGDFSWVREVRTIDSVQHVEVQFRLKEKSDF